LPVRRVRLDARLQAGSRAEHRRAFRLAPSSNRSTGRGSCRKCRWWPRRANHRAPRGRPRGPATPLPAARPAGVVLPRRPPVTQTRPDRSAGYRALTRVGEPGPPRRSSNSAVRAVIPRASSRTSSRSPGGAFRNISAVTAMPTNQSSAIPTRCAVSGRPLTSWGCRTTPTAAISSRSSHRAHRGAQGPAGLLYQGGIGTGPAGSSTRYRSCRPQRLRRRRASRRAASAVESWFRRERPLNGAGTALFRMTGEFRGLARLRRRDRAPALFAQSDADAR